MNPARRRNARRRMMRRQKGKCCYCSQQMRDYGPNNGNRATIEHIKPVALGGSDAVDNLKLACFTCNHQRGSLLTEHLKHFRRKAEEELQQV